MIATPSKPSWSRSSPVATGSASAPGGDRVVGDVEGEGQDHRRASPRRSRPRTARGRGPRAPPHQARPSPVRWSVSSEAAPSPGKCSGRAGEAGAVAAADRGGGELGDERRVVGEGAVGERAVERRDVGDREQVRGRNRRCAATSPRRCAQSSAAFGRARVADLELASARAGRSANDAVLAALLRGDDQRRDPPPLAPGGTQRRDQRRPWSASTQLSASTNTPPSSRVVGASSTNSADGSVPSKPSSSTWSASCAGLICSTRVEVLGRDRRPAGPARRPNRRSPRRKSSQASRSTATSTARATARRRAIASSKAPSSPHPSDGMRGGGRSRAAPPLRPVFSRCDGAETLS